MSIYVQTLLVVLYINERELNLSRVCIFLNILFIGHYDFKNTFCCPTLYYRGSLLKIQPFHGKFGMDVCCTIHMTREKYVV
jgi:hypothetical protein